jgi:hypothetical protein
MVLKMREAEDRTQREEGTRAIRMPMNTRAPNENPFEISQTNLNEQVIANALNEPQRVTCPVRNS